jgi:proline iminopeptidase
MKKIISLIFLIYTLTLSVGLAALEHQQGYVAVPGGKIWYETFFSPATAQRIPLILLHGGPGVPHNYLAPFMPLAYDRPIVFYDQLGCGKSPVAQPSKRLWQLARYDRELGRLIAHLHYKKVNLLGHSWGGALALDYALKHPAQINSLILASPLISTNLWIADSRKLINELPPAAQKIIFNDEAHKRTETRAYNTAMQEFYNRFVFHMQEQPAGLKYSSQHVNSEIYQTMWGKSEFSATGNLKHYEHFNDLKQLAMPVLITGGQFDEARPDTLQRAVAMMPNARLIVYPNSAHFAFINERKKYLTDVRQFLNSADHK